MKLIVMFVGAVCAVLGTIPAIAADSCEGRERYTIHYATHAFEQPFFPILKSGAERGAADACLDLKWTQDVDFSVASTIERMENAIAEKPDILVFSLADPLAMRPTVERALAAGIPVILINVPEPEPHGEHLPSLIYGYVCVRC